MRDLVEEIWSTISRNKLRTILTGLSVAWGIFILIVLLGSGNGLIHAFQSASGTMATNVLEVRGGWTTLAYRGYSSGRSIKLNETDAQAVRERFPDKVIAVALFRVAPPASVRLFDCRKGDLSLVQ